MLKRILSPKVLPWAILAIAIVFYCYEFFLRISPSVVIPQLMLHFQISALGIGAMAFFYYFAYTLGQIPAGYLFDRYPSLHVLSGATFICALASYFFIATHSEVVANSSRFVIGLASSVSFIGVLTLAKRYLSAKYFTLIAGIAISLGTLSASYTQLAATYFIAHFHWTRLFYDSAWIGLLLALLIALSSLLIEKKVNSPKKQDFHFKDVRPLIFNKYLWLNGIMGGLFYLPTSVFAAVWGIQFLQTHYHISSPQAAQCIANLFLGWVIASPLLGYAAEKWHCERLLLQIGCILGSILIFMILYAPGIIAPYLGLSFLLFGILSSTQVVVWKFFKDLIPTPLAGVGIAMTNMIITASTALAHLLVGYLIGLSSHFSDNPLLINSATSLFLMPFALFLGLGVVYFLPKKSISTILKAPLS